MSGLGLVAELCVWVVITLWHDFLHNAVALLGMQFPMYPYRAGADKHVISCDDAILEGVTFTEKAKTPTW